MILNSPLSRACFQLMPSFTHENMDFLEKCIYQIYTRKLDSSLLHKFVADSNVEVGYGRVYALIREQLIEVCKKHKGLVAASAEIYAKKMGNMYKVYQVPGEKCEESKMKVYESIAMVIYYHFYGISQSNKHICELWAILKQKNKYRITGNNYEHPIKTPQLRLSSLNLMTLKELLPSSEHINLSDFNQILNKLQKSPHVCKKQHIKQMLQVYGKQKKQSVVQQDFDQEQQVFADKMMNQLANIEMMSEPIEYKDWLTVIKQNSIGKAALQRLGGKFQQIQGQTGKDVLEGQKNIEDDKGNRNEETSFGKIQDIQNRKKKKKNKKKKSKNQDSEQQKQKAPPLGFFDMKKIDKQSIGTINFLLSMVIDKNKRQSCSMKSRKLQQWKKWAENINI